MCRAATRAWQKLHNVHLYGINSILNHVCRSQGSNQGLRAFGVGEILEVKGEGAGRSAKGPAVPSKIKVRRFYRPEDVSQVRYMALGATLFL